MDAFRTASPLVLASGSPRRKDFLAGLGLNFTVLVADIDESFRSDEKPADFVERLAREKAEAVGAEAGKAWVLAADTVVVIDDHILGKPRDAAEANQMLMRLGGRSHQVWTGFCLYRQDDGPAVSRAVCTEVRFMPLTPALCAAYVRTGEPMDKAGAYGIQGKGCFLVEEVHGSYTNVVGLPLAEVIEEMLRLAIIAPNA